MAAPIKFGVGQSVLRKEDDALIRGKGRYTDDYQFRDGRWQCVSAHYTRA